MFSICSALYFLFFFTFFCQLSKFTADKISDRLPLAVFCLEMTTSLAAAGDFACPPPTRRRRPEPLPWPFAATGPSFARGRRCGHVRQCFFTDFLKDSSRTVLGRLRLADVDDTSSGTMGLSKFLPSSLATGTMYFFTSGMAT